MKKITLTFAIIFCCGFISTGFAQVMEDDSESEQWVSFYEDVHKGKFKPFDFTPVRRADIVDQKKIWRTIDFREKQNQVFYYPIEPTQGRVSLFYALDKAALEGLIKVYKNDDCVEEADWADIKYNKLSSTTTKTVPIYDPEQDMDIDSTITTRIEMKADDVKELRIREDWFFDKQRSVRDVRIFSFAFVLDQGEKGKITPVWIRYDDPEVRQLLANTEVFNPYNDAQRMSYDDLFILRKFSSYVIQESNVYTRTISSYLTGEDALLESNRIEEELFLMDENMWEY